MPGSNTHITQIAQALVAKHAAVMVGAGFSRNADKKYSTNREFLDWKNYRICFMINFMKMVPDRGKCMRVLWDWRSRSSD